MPSNCASICNFHARIILACSSSLSIASRARGPRRHERGRQRDLLGPTGRRCGCWPTSLLRFDRWCGGRRGAGRSVNLTRAESSCARRAGRSDRPARAGWAALRQFRFRDIPNDGARAFGRQRGLRLLADVASDSGSGRTMELGRSGRTPARPRAASVRYGVLPNRRH
jgi:hypothetical protein